MSTKIERGEWKWFGAHGHFVCGHYCRWHLCTQVGPWLVSSVGRLLLSEGVRELLARSRGVELKGMGDAREADYLDKIGYEPLGGGKATFETMVFRAGPPCAEEGCDCGQPTPSDWTEVAGERYATAGEATAGHYRWCDEFAGMEP